MRYFYLFSCLILLFNCNNIEEFDVPVTNALKSPVPDNYYDAQPFKKNNHLGEDWNGPLGGNSDLGEPFFAIGDGVVVYAGLAGIGWGNVIIVRHKAPNGKLFESLYGHADNILVSKGDKVKIGQKIGTIGNAFGQYYAHLHFEIRDSVGMGVKGGYSKDTRGYVSPKEFIKNYK